MSDESKPAEKRLAPRGPDRDSEKALGLEVARLFGLNPRLLAAKAAPVSRGEGDRSGPETSETGAGRAGPPEPEDADGGAD